MKYVLSIFACLLALCPVAASAVVRDGSTSSTPVTFSDGAVATTFDHWGDADLCATIAYPSGDKLSIYSEGAAYCQPYMLHFVAEHRSTTLYEFTRTLNHDAVTSNAFGVHCGNNQATDDARPRARASHGRRIQGRVTALRLHALGGEEVARGWSTERAARQMGELAAVVVMRQHAP